MLESALSFRLLVQAPGGFGCHQLLNAAVDHGAEALLDLVHVPDATPALKSFLGEPFLETGRASLRIRVSQLPLLEPVPVEMRRRLGLVCSVRRGESFRPPESWREVRAEIGCPEQIGELPPGLSGLVLSGSEAGGLCGEAGTFPLLQAARAVTDLPLLVRLPGGGRVAQACRIGGAAGVVLDDALLLLPESPLPAEWKRAALEGSNFDTALFGEAERVPLRIRAIRGAPLYRELAEAEEAGSRPELERLSEALAWDPSGAWPVGQGFRFAPELARTFGGLGPALAAVRNASARELVEPFGPRSAFAREIGTEYPILQGPMTRVSDRVEFAEAVRAGGALPMIALALLRGEPLRQLLEQASARLAGKPWGVGVLGFVPEEIRAEQLEAVRSARPGFAVLAGGRPDQAERLEQDGIRTFVHVASPVLLKRFLERGVRRFIFEGRECGGHVGPHGSAPLWEEATSILLDHIAASGETDYAVVFAGGIHDRTSARMAGVFADPLRQAGARVGVLMGTAYLFTCEAVETGAITRQYQEEAVEGRETVNLPAAAGHANRCLRTPFAEEFLRERQRLRASGVRGDALREALDAMTLGRLRLASKGLERSPEGGLQEQPVEEQHRRGMFMIGEVATLRQSVVSIRDLHQAVCGNAAVEIRPAPAPRRSEAASSADIAVIGISLILPGATSLEEYWEAILTGRCAIREVPQEHWDWRLYYDPDRKAADKTYSKWGGFIDDVRFDPLAYGIPPKAMKSLSTAQILAIELAHRALADAGYANREFDRDRTAVILANADAGGMFGNELAARSLLPVLSAEAGDDFRRRLPSFTEDALPGTLNNLAPGRVANRLDLGGPNFSIDAACASSLCAVDLALSELRSGRSRMAIVGGAETVQTPLGFIGFSKVQALSPTGNVKPFDAEADGIALSDGFVFMVLKPLPDAERDGDPIYAVLKGSASASDGRGLSLTAPRPEGQRRALDRAYESTACHAGGLGLYEAHATGTSVGDRAELETIVGFLKDHGADAATCALGSVKSLIGHTKTAAGLASLAKVCLALRHRVIPGHYGLQKALPPLSASGSPVYVCEGPQPWFDSPGKARLAGVSAFGFGGTNSHLIVEEYRDSPAAPGGDCWPAELLLFSAEEPGAVEAQVERLLEQLRQGAAPRLADLASTLALRPGRKVRAYVVASNLRQLGARLEQLRDALASGRAVEGGGLGWGTVGPVTPRLALVFPGQGSQRIGMVREPLLYFEECRNAFEVADAAASKFGLERVSRLVFPRRAFTEADEQEQVQRLEAPSGAQPALAAVSAGLADLLRRIELQWDAAAGHSFGEWSASYAAGCLGLDAFLELACLRGMRSEEAGDSGRMIAVRAARERVELLLRSEPEWCIANHNTPGQVIVSGPAAGVEPFLERTRALNLPATRLPVGAAFHSPRMEDARSAFRRDLEAFTFSPSHRVVYSNAGDRLRVDSPEQLQEQLTRQLVRPVEFVSEVERMRRDGIHLFLEVGPGTVVSRLVRSIDPEAGVLAIDPAGGSLAGFLETLGELFRLGASFHPARLFEGRRVEVLDLEALPLPPEPSPSTWWVNSCGVRRSDESETRYGEVPLYSSETRARAIEAMPKAHSGAKAPGSAPEVPADAARDQRLQIFETYQQSMRELLATHERVMRAFLEGAATDGKLPAVLPPPFEPKLSSDDASHAPPPASAVTEPDEPSHSSDSGRTVEPTAKPGYLPAEEQPLLENLRKAIAERTGYPLEMVDAKGDLEADLGIDSLTRIEIIESVLQEMEPEDARRAASGMEQISGARRPQELAAAIVQEANRGVALPELPEQPPGSRREPEAVADCPRYLMEALPRELPAVPFLEPEGLHLLTDDPRGISRRLARELESLGAVAVRIAPELLRNETRLKGFVEEAQRSHGPVSGVLHLAGLMDADAESPAGGWLAQQELCARGLFGLLHLCGPDLRRGDALGRVLSASLFGGAFGRNGVCGPGSVYAGAATGLFKSLENEWENVLCKAIDLDPAAEAEAMTRQILEEYLLLGGELEVGYPKGIRTTFRAVAADAAALSADEPFVEGDVVVALGGARGICHEILQSVARPGMKIVVAGRTEIPAYPAVPAPLPDRAEVRKGVLEEIRASGSSIAPAEAEREVDRRLRRLQTAANLDGLRASGAEVRYRVVDARAPEAVAGFLRWAREQCGRIDVLLHAAGIVRDKLLEQKSIEVFDEVFETKVQALQAIEQALPWDEVRLVALFGSVAGRFGNRGQTDYAAANEVLNRAAWRWKALHPRPRILTINWGPWLGSGMASEAVVRQLRSRGIEPVRVDAGVEFFLEELRRQDDAVEVIAGRGPWEDTEGSDADALVELGTALVSGLQARE